MSARAGLPIDRNHRSPGLNLSRSAGGELSNELTPFDTQAPTRQNRAKQRLRGAKTEQLAATLAERRHLGTLEIDLTIEGHQQLHGFKLLMVG